MCCFVVNIFDFIFGNFVSLGFFWYKFIELFLLNVFEEVLLFSVCLDVYLGKIFVGNLFYYVKKEVV